jgi:hypothetical protein
MAEEIPKVSVAVTVPPLQQECQDLLVKELNELVESLGDFIRLRTKEN